MASKSSFKVLSLAFVMLLSGAWVWSEGTTAVKKKLTLKDLLKSSSSTSRRSASVAGVRGLTDTGDGQNSAVRDYTAVDRLDKVVVAEEDLLKFIEEGQLK